MTGQRNTQLQLSIKQNVEFRVLNYKLPSGVAIISKMKKKN